MRKTTGLYTKRGMKTILVIRILSNISYKEKYKNRPTNHYFNYKKGREEFFYFLRKD